MPSTVETGRITTSRKKISRTKKAHSYLTKRILRNAARTGVRQAAMETMNIVGYNVIAHNGWVVKKYANGRIERVTPLKRINVTGGILLD